MSETARERFKATAAEAVRAHYRNIEDRGLNGPRSALETGASGDSPGLLDVLADAAEAAYGDAAPSRRAQRTGAV